MTKQELLKQCANENIEIKEAEHEGKPGVFLRWRNPNNPADDEACFIEDANLGNLNWPTIHKAVVNGRDVTGYTRIVGYFSSVKNWNKSKIGELADRQAGDYKVASGN